jgi:aryl-alcohol dehydrogenase-like predicted oxidoreductase
MDKIAYGSTGHISSRIIFGAAALGAMRQQKADSVMQMVLDAGINHIDVAASYGDAELRLAPFLQNHRSDFFLATKTGDRTYDGAKASIESSLERLQVGQIDVIQFHNLSKQNDWDTVMGPGGALEAAIEARDQGLVRFIGVTGHGTRIAEMHLNSLAAFDFASVLLPYSHMSMQDEQYAKEFESLYKLCMDKGIAMQTIKSIARRRWQEGDESPKFSWYEPIRENEALRRAVHWVLKRPGIFLCSSSDATLLPGIIRAANDFDENNLANLELEVAADVSRQNLEPLFERGKVDDVLV